MEFPDLFDIFRIKEMEKSCYIELSLTLPLEGNLTSQTAPERITVSSAITQERRV